MTRWAHNPVWAHELRLARRRWLRWCGPRHAAWCALAGVGCYAALLAAASRVEGDYTVRGVTNALLYAVIALAPGLAATSLAGERQRGSWPLLSTTPLRPSELLLGKFAGCVLRLGCLCALALPVAHLLPRHEPVRPSPFELAVSGLYVVPVLLGLSALGLWCSARCRTVTRALLWAYGWTALLVVGLPLASAYLYVSWWPATCPLLLDYDEAVPSALEAVPTGINYLLLTAVGLLLPLIHFEEWLRLEGEPASRPGRWLVTALIHAGRAARRSLRRVPGWVLVAYGVVATLCLLREPPSDRDATEVGLALLGAALACLAAALVPAPAPRVAARLRARCGVPWRTLVVGRYLVVTALGGALVLALLGPTLVRFRVGGWELSHVLPRLVLTCGAIAVLLTSRGRPEPWPRALAGAVVVLTGVWLLRLTDPLGNTPGWRLGLTHRDLVFAAIEKWCDDRVPGVLFTATLAGLTLLSAMVAPAEHRGAGRGEVKPWA